jgi:hypothetical protein
MTHQDATMLIETPREVKARYRYPISVRPQHPFRVERVELLSKGYKLVEAHVGSYLQAKLPWETCGLGTSLTLLIEMGPMARKVRIKLHGVSAGGKP